MTFADIHKGKTIIHVVGGQMNDDLEKNLEKIADWFVKNDITLLWGDNYDAKFNKNHPVARLEEEIRKRGGNPSIRIMQMGKIDYNYCINSPDELSLEPVHDEDDKTIMGYYQTEKDGTQIFYTKQQQDRQKLYYNESDGLMVLNGGVGAGYEIPNAFIYGFSGDVASHFKIMVVDSNGKFEKFMKSYLELIGAEIKDFKNIKYFKSAEDFVKQNEKENINE